ncbi:MAG TPA: L-histidine N(alpha)-methyltransferase [Methylocystis sp.]|nr:L-histidine N(alpha)-methyltransferase [Methylocystis sp.]
MRPAVAPRALVPEAGDELRASVIEGLSRRRKALPSRFFYDARGSALFEKITELPEYYLTRAETAILKAKAEEMIGQRFDGAVLVELGSGSSRKTEILLRRRPAPRAYVPIDISQSALVDAASRLKARFPQLDVRPVVGDFLHGAALPPDIAWRKKIGFFPGSTIGNFTPAESIALLRNMRLMLAPGGILLIGADLRKDLRILLPAYNDAAGVTAAFNLNLLARVNREAGGDFNLDAFRHEAIYNAVEGRIEMRLVSLRDQIVSAAERRFRFLRAETIHTENSYKYEIEQFRDIARLAGWSPGRVWTDLANLFSVHELL